jgi:hypothetical protein
MWDSGTPAGVPLSLFYGNGWHQFKKIIHASTNGITKPKQKKNKRSSTPDSSGRRAGRYFSQR